MGKKTHPHALRGYSINKWFSDGPMYATRLLEDIKIRQYIQKVGDKFNMSEICIERSGKKISIVVPLAFKDHSIWGVKDEKTQELKNNLSKILNKKVDEIDVRLEKLYRSNIDPLIVGQKVAQSLCNGKFKFTRRQVIRDAMNFGAKGITLIVSGRLGGSSIARTERYHEGSVPRQTIKEKILYATVQAKTKSGICGVKVIICVGDN